MAPSEFNSYGARRGHHEVMMRGTFGNIRLRNALVAGKEGPYTVHLPDGEEMFIYDAAMRYRREGVPLIDHRRPRVRLRVVARLGGQGHDAAGRPGRHRRELRADPPLEPGRHGRPAARVPARATAPRRSASPAASRSRSRASPPVSRRAAGSPSSPGATTTAANAHSRSWPASTARSTSTTTVRVASCPPSSGVWRLQAE